MHLAFHKRVEVLLKKCSAWPALGETERYLGLERMRTDNPGHVARFASRFRSTLTHDLAVFWLRPSPAPVQYSGD